MEIGLKNIINVPTDRKFSIVTSELSSKSVLILRVSRGFIEGLIHFRSSSYYKTELYIKARQK